MTNIEITTNTHVTVINNINDCECQEPSIDRSSTSKPAQKSLKSSCVTRYDIDTICFFRLAINLRQRWGTLMEILKNQLPLLDAKICDCREPCRRYDCSTCREIKRGDRKRPKRRLGVLEKLVFSVILIIDMFSVGDLLKWAYSPLSRLNRKSWPTKWMPCVLLLQDAEHKRREILDLYIILTTVVLGIVTCVYSHRFAISGSTDFNYICLFVFAFLGAQQIIEMMASTARTVLVDVYDEGQKPASTNRLILMLFLGYIKMLFGFALIYLWLASDSRFDIKNLNPLELSAAVQLSLDLHLEESDSLALKSVIVAQAILTFSMIALFLARMLNLSLGVWERNTAR